MRTGSGIDPEVQKLFALSEPVEIIFQILNDSFDVMNARCPRYAINTKTGGRRKRF